MDKNTRLKLIRKAYLDSRKHKRKLTPKAWQFIKEIRDENKDKEADSDVVVDFNQDDIHEEIQLMGNLRRTSDGEVDWDNARYYDSNTSAEMLYFRRERE